MSIIQNNFLRLDAGLLSYQWITLYQNQTDLSPTEIYETYYTLSFGAPLAASLFTAIVGAIGISDMKYQHIKNYGCLNGAVRFF